ncbi:MAG: tetraacyldisaccharide 4'-kinase, partial [Bacteroidota bacterium]
MSGSARPYLRPLAWLFGKIVARRNRAYEQGKRPVYEAPIPVISIGNISTGGTGKTPLAMYLLDMVAETWPDVKPAYLSRGYGRKTSGYLKVLPNQHLPMQVGDEALQVARRFPELPIAVCEVRKVGIQRLVREEQANLIILDDAFQHRAVARDLDIVVIDAGQLPTQDALLPEGYLREPLSSLDRADLILINKVPSKEHLPGLEQTFAAWADKLSFGYVAPQTVVEQGGLEHPLSALRGRPVMLFAGIGRPEAFAEVVAAQGANIVETHWFRDHHPFRNGELRMLRDRWQALRESHPELWLLTTEKDLSRLQGHMALHLLEQTDLFSVPI